MDRRRCFWGWRELRAKGSPDLSSAPQRRFAPRRAMSEAGANATSRGAERGLLRSKARLESCGWPIAARHKIMCPSTGLLHCMANAGDVLIDRRDRRARRSAHETSRPSAAGSAVTGFGGAARPDADVVKGGPNIQRDFTMLAMSNAYGGAGAPLDGQTAIPPPRPRGRRRRLGSRRRIAPPDAVSDPCRHRD